MILSLLLGTAQAESVQVPLTVCFSYDIDYDEGQSGYDGPGDYWVNNDIDRVARGLFIRIGSNVAVTTKRQLGEDGCWTGTHAFDLGTPGLWDGPATGFWVELFAEGERHGTRVELRNNDERPLPNWPAARRMSYTWGKNVALLGGSTHSFVFPAEDGWQHLAAVMSALTFFDWRLDQGVNRACCVEAAAGVDGTCDDPNSYYARQIEPYGPIEDHFVAILADSGVAQKNLSEPFHPDDNPNVDRSNSCCASKIPWSDDGTVIIRDDLRSGVRVGERVQNRFSITHELGHVVVGLRMGDFERGQYNNTAPHDGCNADYEDLPAATQPVALLETKRGIFQKEYMGSAFREGWADFFSTLAWNSTANPAPEYESNILQDFDMDGDLDNDAAGWAYRRTRLLMGNPEPPSEPGGTSQAPWLQAYDRNWRVSALHSVEACTEVAASACPPLSHVFPSTQVRAGGMESLNRSTIHDVSSLFWHLMVDEGIDPGDLSDLYVDMCPRAWRSTDLWFQGKGTRACLDGDDLPWRRLEASAAFHGHTNAVDSHADRVIGR